MLLKLLLTKNVMFYFFRSLSHMGGDEMYPPRWIKCKKLNDSLFNRIPIQFLKGILWQNVSLFFHYWLIFKVLFKYVLLKHSVIFKNIALESHLLPKECDEILCLKN